MKEPFKDFSCSYTYEGRRWGFSIQAPSFEEASRRMRAIGMTGQVDGLTVANVTVVRDMPRIIRWIMFVLVKPWAR